MQFGMLGMSFATHRVSDGVPQRLLFIGDLELGLEEGNAALDMTGHRVLAHHHLHHAHHRHTTRDPRR